MLERFIASLSRSRRDSLSCTDYEDLALATTGNDMTDRVLGLDLDIPTPEREEMVQAENRRFRKRIFTPAVTVWAFLSQMLSEDKSCKNAVSRIIADRAVKGEPIPSADASAYSQARQRFPEYKDIARKRAGEMPPGCDCARVVLGKIYPDECQLYGKACTPRNPVGPCMVSDEGACRIWWAGGVRKSKPAA